VLCRPLHGLGEIWARSLLAEGSPGRLLADDRSVDASRPIAERQASICRG
jgi:hypothetical protein